MKREQINRTDLLRRIAMEFPNGKGAEIGCFKGQFSKDIVSNWGGKLYMVDVWRPLGSEYEDGSNHANFENGVYSDAMENIRGFEYRAFMIRAASADAAEIFADESLDFVYIDANHAYDFVVQDIELWYPKVKKGGYLWGHDFLDLDWKIEPYAENGKDKYIYSLDGTYMGVFGVNPAVEEFCEKNGYEFSVTEEWFGSWCLKKK